MLIYNADFGAADGVRALGYATVAAQAIEAIPLASGSALLAWAVLLAVVGAALHA